MPVSADPNLALLVMIGGDAADSVVRKDQRIRISGASDLTRLLLPSDSFHRLHVTRNKLRRSRRPKLEQYTHLLNLITEAEDNARSLDAMQKLLRGVPGKIINSPQAVLRTTRDKVARRLKGLPGLVVPEVVRLAAGKSAEICVRQLSEAGAAPPFILRQAGTHSGIIVGTFDSIESLIAARDPAVEHIATRFVDFQSDDGLYRKYRVFFIGGALILRHMLISDSWNVHANDRGRYMAEHPAAVAEERALFEQADPFNPQLREVLHGVRDRMGLDFFGMDFGITRDRDVVLFEANATMNFFPFSADPQFAHLQRAFLPARQAFRELLGLPPEQPGRADLSLHLEPA